MLHELYIPVKSTCIQQKEVAVWSDTLNISSSFYLVNLHNNDIRLSCDDWFRNLKRNIASSPRYQSNQKFNVEIETLV